GKDNANRWMMEAKELMRTREERWINYLGGLAVAFTEESHSDIQVKPSDGPSIPAHKFLLATRSEVFKHMLSSDTCKSAQINSVCLPEFNHEQLQTFLELLYCGNLAKEKFEMHYYCLALASHKYAIPHLEKFCEEHILKLIDSSNALKVLEISEICSNETLRVAALQMIINHKKEIICAPSFQEFVTENPHLVKVITQMKEEMKQREERWIHYLGGLATAFTEESHSDIQVKPGDGPSVPAHKFLLETRSKVFKHMLSSDTCKSAQINSVCLPEFNHEQLQTFLELLYCGNLAKEKFEMHYYCLALASH
ncbi:hypothetical protein MKW92_004518, partial [Papaver armeniacum]